VRRVLLGVADGNTAARCLYEELGFWGHGPTQAGASQPSIEEHEMTLHRGRLATTSTT
jgi:hypothetical protein